MSQLRGNVTQAHCNQVREAMGPNACVVSELLSQSRDVISTRSISRRTSSTWCLRGSNEIAQSNSTPLTVQSKITKFLQNAFSNDMEQFEVLRAQKAAMFHSKNVNGGSLTRGDIIQVLCYRPDDTPFHFPFLVQFHSIQGVTNWKESSGPSLWCILEFF